MNQYKVDTSSARVYINDTLCQTVASLVLEVDKGSPQIECEITCIDQNEYTGYWEEHRVYGYLERVYADSYYLVIKKDNSTPYFQQFIAS